MKSSGSFAADSEKTEGTEKVVSPGSGQNLSMISTAALITTTQLEEIAEVDSEHGN